MSSLFGRITGGIRSAMRWLNSDDDPELRRAREQGKLGGEAIGEKEAKPSRDRDYERLLERERKPEPYDVWEEVRNIRTSFFLGSWASRKIKSVHVGEDKLKKELEELEKKREEERRRKEEEGG